MNLVRPVSGSTLQDHPAVVAWRRLRPERSVPDVVEGLRASAISEVYRLVGVGHGDTAVIAKRSPLPEAMIERSVYEEVLPDVPVSSLHFYGMTADDDHGWLFMEDVGAERLSPASPAHRTMAAMWLGRLHTATAHHDVAAQLPDRGPSYYLDHLRFGRETITGNVENPALTPDDRTLLADVVAQCDALERDWGRIERLCAEVPSTLVHGDFRPKNVRVRTQESGTSLFPLDWETAGWGPPAADLAAPPSSVKGPGELVDLETYASIARDFWPGVTADGLEDLVVVGGVFRRLLAISWESLNLTHQWPQKGVVSMRVYRDDLRHLWPGDARSLRSSRRV